MFRVDCSYSTASGYLTGAETMEGAIKRAQWARSFYGEMYPGTVRIAVWLECEGCQGHGRIAKGRKGVRFPKYIDCPCCKGCGSFPVPAVA